MIAAWLSFSSSFSPLLHRTGSEVASAAVQAPARFDSPTGWELCRSWVGGHTGVVRSVMWDSENEILISGGEDSQLRIWSSPMEMDTLKRLNSFSESNSSKKRR